MSASQQGFAQAEMLTSDSRRLERAEVLTCLSRPLHRLLREPVQRPDGELEVLFRCVLVFGVTEAPQALDKEHYRRHQARPLGSRCDCPVTSSTASSAREIRSSSKGMGSMRHKRFHSTETPSSSATRA